MSLLNDPSKFSNRFYHIADGVLTLQDVLRIFEKETGVSWGKSSYSIKEGSEVALVNLQSGIYGVQEFFGTLMAPFFGGLQVFKKLDNKVFGIEDGEVDMRQEMARFAKKQIKDA